MNIQAFGYVVRQEPLQPVRLEIFGKDESRPINNARSCERGVQEYIHIIRGKLCRSRDLAGNTVLIGKTPIANGGGAAKGQAVMIPQIRWFLRASFFF